MAKAKGALVVVESPAKARTIGKYLGKHYTVKATVGHLRDLPQRELGVDIENGFAPKYVTIRGKGQTLAELKKVAKRSSDVFLATDPDREGEAIAWHIADQLGDGANVSRVLFHEITKGAVSEAMKNPIPIDVRKVDAQQARRILDRLVGYKASPLLWKSVKTGLSAGRVQTVALRLLVEREAGIEKFKPKEYWSIEAELKAKRKQFTAKLHKIDGANPELKSEKAARAVVDAVSDAPFVVSKVTRRERRKRPAGPFTTSTMQQEASKRLGFSAQRTMRTAQQLYEGIELEAEGAVGLITYMRTDSTRVAGVAIDHVREFIGKNYDAPYLPEKPNMYKSKNVRSQDAHEAVRPTDAERTPDAIKRALTADQYKLYRLIWQRFVASQMTPLVYDTTTIDFDIDKYLFRATGSVVKFDGFQVLYRESKEAEEDGDPEDLAPVPALHKGDKVEVLSVTPNQHFTEPPPRFSEASLVKELERLGIGRPSTYSTIISTLRNRDYVEVTDRRFTPTSLGRTVSKVMVSRFPDIFNVQFTSGMEEELDKIEEGKLGWQAVLKDFYDPFSKDLENIDVEEMIREAHDLGDLEKERCGDCDSTLTVKSGRFGPFIACTKYPECKYTRPIKKDRPPDRPTEEKCQECGSAMVIKTGRYGEFLACTRYPDCQHTRPVPLGVKCPVCEVGDLTQRRTRRGRVFYGCVRYPDCEYSTWYEPLPETCPKCKKEGVERRSSKVRGEYRRCIRCEHEFDAEEPAAAGTES
jgi:DNA topoisomerase-1